MWKKQFGIVSRHLESFLSLPVLHSHPAEVFLTGKQRAKLSSFLQAPFTGNYGAQSAAQLDFHFTSSVNDLLRSHRLYGLMVE